MKNVQRSVSTGREAQSQGCASDQENKGGHQQHKNKGLTAAAGEHARHPPAFYRES
ncbi:hypothetical protein NZJ93_01710 [Desulfofundulus thermocisternus]|nr:hypothetical protein [Desulfofundulus thermocisternus]